MKEKLLEILNQVKPGVDYEQETALVDKQFLDSIDIISIISELSDAFDVDVPFDEIVPDNFNSLEAMMAMIERLSD